MKQAILIHSPHSGRAAQLEQALSLLRQHNIAIIDVVSIADLDGLPPQGHVWQARGLNIVIAAGGDGLVGGVITHIAASDLPLGIIPLGYRQRYRSYSPYPTRHSAGHQNHRQWTRNRDGCWRSPTSRASSTSR